MMKAGEAPIGGENFIVLSDEDLRQFECQRCGGCCLIRGAVRVSESEMAQMAEYLRISVAEFCERCTIKIPLTDREIVILRDHPGTTRCMFLDEHSLCVIHPVKPRQCRQFPLGWRDPSSFFYCVGLQRLHQINVGANDNSLP